MAFKSEAQLIALIQAIVAGQVNFDTDATAFESDFNSISGAIMAGDDAPEDAAMMNALIQLRNAYGNVYAAWLNLARQAVPALGRLAGSPNLADNNLNLDYFRQYMADNSEYILDRGIVKDTASTISGTSAGAGKLTISSTDVDGEKIDVGHVENLSLICNKDVSEGATAGSEEFQIVGEDNVGKFPWEEGGSGTNGASYDYPYGKVRSDFGSGQKRAVSGGIIKSVGGSTASGNLLVNGDFETPISGSGATKLPSWNISAGDTAITQETADPIFGTYSISADDNFTMSNILTVGRVKPRAAYFIAIKLERGSSADGTLTVKVMDSDGGTTHATLTQSISALTNSTPVLIQPVIFILPDNAEDIKVQVQLASNTTGTVKIDDVILAPAYLVDGYLLALADGTTQDASGYAQGRFKNGDKFVIQTTAGTSGEGLIQEFFFNRPWGRYMPSAESPTWNDPS